MIVPDHLGSIRSIVNPRTEIYYGSGSVAKGDFVVSLLRDNLASRHVLIADERVHRLYGRRLAAVMGAAGVDLKICLVPSLESSKSVDVYLRLVEQTLTSGVDKGSHVITLGGGVTSNVGGFVAATVFRGLPLIHLPSSLMAQLDACIDVRQAINHRHGKNLIGALYPPRAVVVDPALLTTLPTRHLRSGIAEAVKHSLTQSRAFYRHLLDQAAHLRESEFLERVVRETIRLKLSLMSRRARGDADSYLQYGHCIGHAIETASHYSQLHGEAIAIGMTISAEIAVSMKLAGPTLVREHLSVLRAYCLPVSLPREASIDAVMEAIAHDKNTRLSTPRMGLLRRIGCLYRSNDDLFAHVEADVLRKHLATSRMRKPKVERRNACDVRRL